MLKVLLCFACYRSPTLASPKFFLLQYPHSTALVPQRCCSSCSSCPSCFLALLLVDFVAVFLSLLLFCFFLLLPDLVAGLMLFKFVPSCLGS